MRAEPLDLDELTRLIGRINQAMSERNLSGDYACALWHDDQSDSDGCGYCSHCVRWDAQEAYKLLQATRADSSAPLPGGSKTTSRKPATAVEGKSYTAGSRGGS